MFKSKINQIIVISALCLVVISMGLFLTAGSYSRALKIVNDSNSNQVEKTFNILLKENTYLESNGSISPNQKSFTKTTANYNISINPGQYYEFTIAVENQGTIDAKLTSIKSTGLTDEQEQLLKYTVYYSNEYYSRNIDNLNIGLGTNAVDYLRIRVEYPLIAGTNQPSLNNLNLSTTLEYTEL